MCGIGGILYFENRPVEESLIRRMTAAMAHRGPDAAGFFEDSGIALGHRRLAIIDLSDAANQPFTDHSDRYVVVFNGEIYNYAEVRLMIPEYAFHTGSDTEVLIAAYAKWGAGCLSLFRGMFAFAVWDKEAREIFLARDPMGVKPLYYFLDGEKLIFASEIRAILETGLVKKKAAPVALVNYLSCQSVPFPYSAVENIRQVQAGSWMKVGNGKTEEVVYWDPAAGLQHADYGDEPKIRQRIKELMMQSVQRRLVSDVPVGAFLSGGIDSSVVVGLMAESGSTRPNTFTVSFDEQEFDESHYAELIAEKFNTCHERILLKPDAFLETLPDALNAMDIPSGDGINTYMVSKAVHEKGMRVALSGTGGDELFAGYPFFHQYLQLHSRQWLWKLPAVIRRQAGAWITGNERIRQLLRMRSISIDQVYPVFRQILPPGKIRQLASLNGEHNFTTAWEKILADRKERLEALPLLSQVSVAEYLGYTQHTLLKDMDQMGMAVSLEIREPFFDQDLVEFVMAIPDSIKRPKYPKSLLVESVRPLLPDSIVFRKKQGFVFPWQSWLKHELRSFCEQYLRHMEERTFVHGKKLRQYWQSFLGGDSRIRWMEIWLFVVLEYWMEKNGIE